MTTENIVSLDSFKGAKERKARIQKYNDYLKLLDNAELVNEAKGFMGEMKQNGLKEDCAHKGQKIINELISRVKDGRFSASKKLMELQQELDECLHS